MPVHKTTCPDCGATLKSSNPMPPGKKVKCPKCGTGFVVPEDEVPTAPAKPAAKAAQAPKKAAPAPAPGPKPPDDDEGGTYGVIKEPEDNQPEEDDDDDDDEDDEEGGKKKKKKKVDLAFMLDTSVVDPRGPAHAAVVKPSNMLMLLGAIMCVLCVVGICYCIFPLIFSAEWVEQAKVLGWSYKEDTIPPHKDLKELKPEEVAKIQDAESEFMVWRLVTAGGIVFTLLLCGLWVFGGVKMQNLESWGWGLAGSIIAIFVLLQAAGGWAFNLIGSLGPDPDIMITMLMGMVNLVLLLALLVPISCIRVLCDPKVKEGFAHERAEREKRGGGDFG